MSCDISNELLDSYKQIFDLFDKNNDGQISFREYKMVVATYNVNIHPDIVNDCFFNYVKGEEMDFKTFVEVMHKHLENEYSEEEIKTAFRVFDIDKDGGISTQDYKKTMKQLGDELSIKQIEETFNDLGLGPHDKIDYELFKKMLTEPINK